jgi:hypothetical protein
MALPPSLLPAELEFISEETLVHIVPLFSMDPIRLLSVRAPAELQSPEGRSS